MPIGQHSAKQQHIRGEQLEHWTSTPCGGRLGYLHYRPASHKRQGVWLGQPVPAEYEYRDTGALHGPTLRTVTQLPLAWGNLLRLCLPSSAMYLLREMALFRAWKHFCDCLCAYRTNCHKGFKCISMEKNRPNFQFSVDFWLDQRMKICLHLKLLTYSQLGRKREAISRLEVVGWSILYLYCLPFWIVL